MATNDTSVSEDIFVANSCYYSNNPIRYRLIRIENPSMSKNPNYLFFVSHVFVFSMILSNSRIFHYFSFLELMEEISITMEARIVYMW